MKVLVVTGFLGAGKTTFLKRILQEADSKTVVLINEFGELGIDADVVSEKGGKFGVVELPSGCICCTLASNVVEELATIKKNYNPDRVIIEPSGVASPSSLLDLFNAPKLEKAITLKSVVGIIDGTTLLDFLEKDIFGPFFYDQLKNSDVLLLNKTDRMDNDLIEQSEKKLKEMNPSAIIYRTEYCNVELELADSKKTMTPVDFHMDFDSFSITTNNSYPKELIEVIFEKLNSKNFGEIYRAKGIFLDSSTGGLVNFTPGHVSVEDFEQPEQSKFVFIGHGLDKDGISKLLEGDPRLN